MRIIDGLVKISVRDLVEFVLRRGSINTSVMSSNRAVIGTMAHKKLQQEAKGNYEAEVRMVYEEELDGTVYVVEGRADGIIKDLLTVTIDEIKTTETDLEIIDENYNYLHWAQAKCYAYFYAKKENLEEIQVRLTYYHIETKEIKYLYRSFFFEELERFFNELLKSYDKWIKFYMAWTEKRDASLRRLEFPFSKYREGQRPLAGSVYRAIREEEVLYINAPTGIGKTMSTLFPALKAMGEGYNSKIFYLTAKTITRKVVEEAADMLYEKGAKIKIVTLTAKDKICLIEERKCHPDFCSYANGHYDRVDDAVYKLINEQDLFTRDVIEAAAKKYNVCPFELALDLATWADVVICDYNYIFDPIAALKRFIDNKDFVLLIDEAHNLVDRAREMYSASFSKKQILAVKREMGKAYKDISKPLAKLNEYLLEIKQGYIEEMGTYITKEAPKEFYKWLRRFMGAADKHLQQIGKGNLPASLLDLYFEAYVFSKIYELFDDHYMTYAENIGSEVKLRMYAIDPSAVIKSIVDGFRSVIFFSATLLPIDYFKYMLGGEEEKAINFESPFKEENALKLVASDVSTRYRDREQSYEKICKYIKAFTNSKIGNYMVFFPSYKYMLEVYECFKEETEIEVYIQSSNMTEEEKEAFLERFKEKKERSSISFCVLGGVFSEGIDLRGEQLIGVIVVGVGLPQLSLERDLIKGYFDDIGKDGYHYAYTYPGMNKVLQALGRLIRTEEDKGVMLLIDDRFGNLFYRQLFPASYRNRIYITGEEIESVVKEFWENTNN